MTKLQELKQLISFTTVVPPPELNINQLAQLDTHTLKFIESLQCDISNLIEEKANLQNSNALLKRTIDAPLTEAGVLISKMLHLPASTTEQVLHACLKKLQSFNTCVENIRITLERPSTTDLAVLAVANNVLIDSLDSHKRLCDKLGLDSSKETYEAAVSNVPSKYTEGYTFIYGDGANLSAEHRAFILQKFNRQSSCYAGDNPSLAENHYSAVVYISASAVVYISARAVELAVSNSTPINLNELLVEMNIGEWVLCKYAIVQGQTLDTLLANSNWTIQTLLDCEAITFKLKK